jgi:hypothetical protein
MKVRVLVAFPVVLLAACAAPRARSALPPAPPFYVPSAAQAEAPGVRPLNPYAVLASADEEALVFPRGERFAYGSFPLFGFSAATTYVYDAQNISAPRGTGFRYSWIVRSSLSTP